MLCLSTCHFSLQYQGDAFNSKPVVSTNCLGAAQDLSKKMICIEGILCCDLLYKLSLVMIVRSMTHQLGHSLPPPPFVVVHASENHARCSRLFLSASAHGHHSDEPLPLTFANGLVISLVRASAPMCPTATSPSSIEKTVGCKRTRIDLAVLTPWSGFLTRAIAI
eukprot:5685434-Amphidinium_carterae.2